jgi:hypothetical protein
MTGLSAAAVALAVAVLVRPGGALPAARLAGLRTTVPAQPSLSPRRRFGAVLPWLAAFGTASLPVAFAGRLAGLAFGVPLGLAVFAGFRWLHASRAAGLSAPRLPLPLLVAAGVVLVPVAVTHGPTGLVFGVPLGLAAWWGTRRLAAPVDRWLATVRLRRDTVDPLRLASCWDLLAACLHGGLPVPVAVQAVAAEVPAKAADALRRTAELLALGADPVAAWEPALAEPLTAELARGARRSTRSGAALAAVAENLATGVRAGADDLAEARAQRTAVAVTGPLGLCFLPAFLCVGVVPVVIGLAARLMASW